MKLVTMDDDKKKDPSELSIWQKIKCPNYRRFSFLPFSVCNAWPEGAENTQRYYIIQKCNLVKVHVGNGTTCIKIMKNTRNIFLYDTKIINLKFLLYEIVCTNLAHNFV